MAAGNVPSEVGALDGVETPRIQMTLTSCILVERYRRVDLGHAGHQAINSWRWDGLEQLTNESNREQ